MQWPNLSQLMVTFTEQPERRPAIQWPTLSQLLVTFTEVRKRPASVFFNVMANAAFVNNDDQKTVKTTDSAHVPPTLS